MEPIPWITLFPPVAPLEREFYLPQSGTVSPDDLSLQTACLEAFKTVKGFIDKRHVLISFVDQTLLGYSSFSNPALLPIFITQISKGSWSVLPKHLTRRPQIDDFSSVHETFGGKKHLGNLADNLVDLAYDFYLEVYFKTFCGKPIEVYIIAAESGVYLAMKVVNFLAKHGLNPVFLGDSRKFDKAWIEFLVSGEELSTEWPLRLDDISIVLAIFIQPSLPSPTSILPLYRPQFYGKNPPPVDHAMQRRVLVVWFRNHHINESAYERIPISGQHTQMLEFDSVLNPFYKMALQTLVENLDAPCTVCV